MQSVPEGGPCPLEAPASLQHEEALASGHTLPCGCGQCGPWPLGGSVSMRPHYGRSRRVRPLCGAEAGRSHAEGRAVRGIHAARL